MLRPSPRPVQPERPAEATARTGLQVHTLSTPMGEVRVAWAGHGIVGIHFRGDHRSRAGGGRPPPGTPGAEACRQLDEYFAGRRREFDLPLAPSGTGFQLTVWAALQEIPFGATVSYGEIARRVGSPRAARGVGGAVGRNPISIVVPCHRVIGSDDSLTGYGGGLDRKRFLLSLEGRTGELFEGL